MRVRKSECECATRAFTQQYKQREGARLGEEVEHQGYSLPLMAGEEEEEGTVGGGSKGVRPIVWQQHLRAAREAVARCGDG